MARSAMRELIREAQRAELEGEVGKAVQNLEQAAAEALNQSDVVRAVSLLRHCLRLEPGRDDLLERLERLGVAEPDGLAPAEPGRPPLELPQRGPAAADPSVDCWCSFCCRPKDEVGPMVAGPAGAFICASCLVAAVRIAELRTSRSSAAGAAAPPSPAAAPGFIEAAVVLSRQLHWSLAEIRSLSPGERQRALEVLKATG